MSIIPSNITEMLLLEVAERKTHDPDFEILKFGAGAKWMAQQLVPLLKMAWASGSFCAYYPTLMKNPCNDCGGCMFKLHIAALLYDWKMDALQIERHEAWFKQMQEPGWPLGPKGKDEHHPQTHE